MTPPSPPPSAPVPSSPAAPTVAGHKMLRQIGGGGYGNVWLAQNDTGIYRAIKIVYRSKFQEERPYIREFAGIKRFEPISREHIGLVDVLQVIRNESEGYFYYVMELADDVAVEGNSNTELQTRPLTFSTPSSDPQESTPSLPSEERVVERRPITQSHQNMIDHERYAPKTLASVLRSRRQSQNGGPPNRLPASECIDIATRLAAALAYMHDQGIVHRDIKPSNIVFVQGQPKLADPGLAAAAGEEMSFVGTEGFVAPEGPGSPQADIYALGKLLYQMVTGLNPKEDDRTLEPHEKYPSLPPDWLTSPDHEDLNELRHIFLRACERDQRRRYATARDMCSDLELLKSGKSLAMRKLQLRLERMKWVMAGTVVIAALAVAISAAWLFKTRGDEQRRLGLLRGIDLLESRLLSEGWATNSWQQLLQAASIRSDSEVTARAVTLLSGLDAKPIVVASFSAGCAVFSPDDRALVSGSATNSTLLIHGTGAVRTFSPLDEGPVCWPTIDQPMQLAASGTQLSLLNPFNGSVLYLLEKPDVKNKTNAFAVLSMASNGCWAAASMEANTFLWSLQQGKLVRTVAGAATALAFSPDGSTLAVGDSTGAIRLYSVPSLTSIGILTPVGRSGPILSLAFGRDPLVRYVDHDRTNQWLLAAGDQGALITVWDLAQRAPRSFCRGSSYLVKALAFSPDGMTLASAGRNQPRLWDFSKGQLLLQLNETSSGESAALAFNHNGSRLVCGGKPGPAWAITAEWQIEPDRGIMSLRGLTSAVRKTFFAPTSGKVAALSDDWHLSVWNIRSNRLDFVFEVPVAAYTDNADACFDPEAEHIAYVGQEEAIVYDLLTGRVTKHWSLEPGYSNRLRFTQQHELLLLRSEVAGGRLRWRLRQLTTDSGAKLLLKQGSTDWKPEDMAIAPAGNSFFVWTAPSKGSPRDVYAYDRLSGRELWRGSMEWSDNPRVFFDPTGRFFAFTPFAGLHSPHLLGLEDFKALTVPNEPFEAISPHADLLASGFLMFHRSGQPRVLPLGTPSQGASGPPAFSPDGKLLVWGTEEGVVHVANLAATRAKLAQLPKQDWSANHNH